MYHLVKVNLAFALFAKGEKLSVSDRFLQRYGRYVTVLESREWELEKYLLPVEYEDDVTEEPADGTGDHLPSEG